MRLLERDDLLESLAGRVESARHGEGSMVLVAGEAGAGKTSLVRALTDRLGGDILTLEGACDPLATPRPLSPLYDMAADPDSGLAELFSADQDSMDIFGEVLERLKESMRPILMVVEDAHWADEATLDFLRFMGRRVGSTKALVLCTYRDDEVGADHPLRQVLGQLIPLSSTNRMVVPPLSESAVSTLAEGHELDAQRLHRMTAGNAFFVTEVIAAGGQMPNTVQDAVLARVGRLRPTARRIVEAVSIAPRSLEIERSRLLVGASAADVDEGVGAGVILGDGGNLRFRHELARAAVEESLPPARRLELHRKILSLLEEDDERDPARLAHHAIRAEAPELIAEYAPEAAEQALARGARREAVAFYRAALEHPVELGAGNAADLRVKLASELRLLGDPDASEHELRQAIDHFRKTDQKVELADALGLLQAALWNQKRIDEGWVAMNEAIELLRPIGPSEVLAYTLYRISHAHMLARRRQPAFSFIDEARSVAETVGSVRARWAATMTTGTIHIVVGDAQEGVRLLGDAVNEAERLGDHHLVSVALGMLGSGGGEARLYADALPALERTIQQGLATDEDYGVEYARSWLARIVFEQGRWDEAADYARLVQKTTVQPEGIAVLTAMSALGRLRVRRGDPGGVELLEQMVEIGRRHELQHAWNAICGRAEYFWLRGEPELGLDELAGAYQRALDTDSPWARGEVGFWMWRAGAIDGPPANAAEPFALHMSGRWREAAEIWRELGCPYEVALALIEGDEKAVLEAITIFDSLGARPAARMARARLREMGTESIPRGPTKETQANPANLTARQLEVLQLMATGMTNSEIADDLFISKKTVEHHVSAIYSKLGVDTRPKAIATATKIGVST